MLILLTNDDGIYAPGLQALEAELRKLGDVIVVAPATEQSGVGHSSPFSRPSSPNRSTTANASAAGPSKAARLTA